MEGVVGMDSNTIHIGMIGAGTMGSILIRRFATSPHVAKVSALDPAPRARQRLSRIIDTWYEAHEYARMAAEVDLLVMAVKPQDFVSVARHLRAVLSERADGGGAGGAHGDGARDTGGGAGGAHGGGARGVLSIMAGVSLAQLRAQIGNGPAIARMMPNIAAEYGRATVALALADNPPPQWRETLLALGSRLGAVVEVGERHFDTVIALSGSGIAFGLQVIHALTLAGVEAGMGAEMAEQIATQMFEGAAVTLRRSKKHPQQLIREICSPGGTTIAGVAALERGGVSAALMAAARATIARAKEM